MSVDKNVLRQVLLDRIDVIRRLEVLDRELVLEDNTPTILVGVRRCGKSYMLYQKMKDFISKGKSYDDFLYVNFEDERLLGFDVNDFNTLLEVYYSINDNEPVLFLDEIQIIDGWEKFARRMADEKRKVYITGSNSKMLSNEMAASLGGRFIAKKVFTFSFDEFIKSKEFIINKKVLSSTKGKAEIEKYFMEYLKYGGFPELTEVSDKRDYLSSVYNKVFLGDIITRYSLTNVKALEIMMKKLAESVCQPLSYSRITNVIEATGVKVGKSTIIQYIEYVKESQLIFSLNEYNAKLVDKVSNQKYYFIDVGLLNLFYVDVNSATLENLVAIDLVKNYGFDEVYYYHHNIEVDFYIPSVSYAIQVCYSMSDDSTRQREINALLKMMNYLDIQRSIIITNNEEETIEVDDKVIEVIPIYKWLLRNDI